MVVDEVTLPRTINRQDPDVVEYAVRRRAAVGLRWSILARLAFLMLGLISVLFVTVNTIGLVTEVGVMVVGCFLALAGLKRVNRMQGLRSVALVLAAFDLWILMILPLAWYLAAGGTDVSPAFLLKNELFLVSAVLVVINTLSLQPLYPALVSLGAAVLHIALLALVMYDGRIEFTEDPFETFNSGKVNVAFFWIRVVTLLLIGGFLSALAWTTRRTIREAVEARVAESETRRRQTELVLEGRMDGLTSLVAGLAHEVNTPLGALLSSASTTERAVQRVRVDDPAVRIIHDSNRTVMEAGGRINELIGRLRAFARLDQADVLLVSVGDEIERVFELIPSSKKGSVEVELSFEPSPLEFSCRSRSLNQVFYTILENAFEALEGTGKIRVTGRKVGDDLEVVIEDDGPGIPEEERDRLLELRLERSDRRVGMGLGLPSAKRIIEGHGGEVTVETSSLGGASFGVRLSPIATSSTGG